jgi:hypothetical protein
MAKKRKTADRLTAEELERRAETRRMAYELAAYHAALAKRFGEDDRRRAVLGESGR